MSDLKRGVTNGISTKAKVTRHNKKGGKANEVSQVNKKRKYKKEAAPKFILKGELTANDIFKKSKVTKNIEKQKGINVYQINKGRKSKRMEGKPKVNLDECELSRIYDKAIEIEEKKDEEHYNKLNKEAVEHSQKTAVKMQEMYNQHGKNEGEESYRVLEGQTIKEYKGVIVEHNKTFQGFIEAALMAQGGAEDYKQVFSVSLNQKQKKTNNVRVKNKKTNSIRAETVQHTFPIHFNSKMRGGGFDVMVSPLNINWSENEGTHYIKNHQYDYNTIGEVLDALVESERGKGHYKEKGYELEKMREKINTNLGRIYRNEAASSHLSLGAVKILSDFVVLQRLEIARAMNKKENQEWVKNESEKGAKHVVKQMMNNSLFSKRYNTTNGTMIGSHSGGAKELRQL